MANGNWHIDWGATIGVAAAFVGALLSLIGWYMRRDIAAARREVGELRKEVAKLNEFRASEVERQRQVAEQRGEMKARVESLASRITENREENYDWRHKNGRRMGRFELQQARITDKLGMTHLPEPRESD